MPVRRTRATVRSRVSRGSFKRETGLGRRANAREERRSVLIVTNGEKTEAGYFRALREESWVTADKVTVKFEPGQPTAIVLRAASIREDNAYDEAWIVSDVDEFDVKPAIDSARNLEVEVALSVPCFEVWLILHLSQACPGFNNAKQAGDYLKKLVRTWDKTAPRFDDFRTGVFDAVTRAQRLGEPPDANPSTSVWKLIESFRRATDLDV